MTAHRRKLDEGMPLGAAGRVGQRELVVAEQRLQYRPPRLRDLGCAADLLEMLGPAQANYGGPNVL